MTTLFLCSLFVLFSPTIYHCNRDAIAKVSTIKVSALLRVSSSKKPSNVMDIFYMIPKNIQAPTIVAPYEDK